MASSKFSDVILDTEFADLYHEIIPTIFDLRNRQLMRDFKIALKDIRQLKHDIEKRDDKCFFAEVQFRKPSYRAAYLYAYSVLHSAVVYNHFLNYLQNNVSVISQYFSMKKLKLCCLGGGPGIEAVAICKVIQNFLISINDYESSSLDVYITVIDICPEWETDLSSIVAKVSKHSSFLDSQKIKLHAKFIQADLMKPLEENVKEEIKEANIVTMIKLASAIEEKTPYKIGTKLEKMVENVANCMDKESSLLLLDNAGGSSFHRLLKILSNSSSLTKMETMAHEKHSLNVRALQKMEQIMKLEKKASYFLCLPTRITTVSSCFWIKKAELDKVSTEEERKHVSTAEASESNSTNA